MKVEQEFAPVTITLETGEELDLLWEIVEEVYLGYESDSEKRQLLMKLSDLICDRHH